MFSIVFVIHIIICFAILGLVIIQQGKGAEAGAIFGSSSSEVASGPIRKTDFITKLTTSMAIAFMITSVLLIKSYQSAGTTTISDQDLLKGSVVEKIVTENTAQQDAVTATTETKIDVETATQEAAGAAEEIAAEATTKLNSAKATAESVVTETEAAASEEAMEPAAAEEEVE